jgi:hypothetical protein
MGYRFCLQGFNSFTRFCLEGIKKTPLGNS